MLLPSAALGAMLAWAGVRGIVWLKPEGLPRMTDIRLDGPVLAFAIFVALVSAVLFGLYPALHGTEPALSSRVTRRRAGSDGIPPPRACRLSRDTGCALHDAVGRSGSTAPELSQAASTRTPAFAWRVWCNSGVNPVGLASRNAEGVQQLYQEILRRVRALPGVESASAAITMRRMQSRSRIASGSKDSRPPTGCRIQRYR